MKNIYLQFFGVALLATSIAFVTKIYWITAYVSASGGTDEKDGIVDSVVSVPRGALMWAEEFDGLLDLTTSDCSGLIGPDTLKRDNYPK